MNGSYITMPGFAWGTSGPLISCDYLDPVIFIPCTEDPRALLEISAKQP